MAGLVMLTSTPVATALAIDAVVANVAVDAVVAVAALPVQDPDEPVVF